MNNEKLRRFDFGASFFYQTLINFKVPTGALVAR